MKTLWLNSWTDPTDHGRITVVFQNRNMAYGAFDLRKRYNTALLKALMIATFILLSLFVIPYLKQMVTADLPDPDFENTVIDLTPPPETAPATPESPKPDPGQKALTAAMHPISTIIGDQRDNEMDSLDLIDDELLLIVGNPASSGGAVLPGGGSDEGTGTEPSVTVAGPSTETVPLIVEEMPEFKGGFEAMYEYLSLATQYPEAAQKDHVNARLFVGFIVEKDGTLSDVRILKCNQSGYGFEEETLRVIQSMPAWKPGRQNGHNVRVRYNIPFQFKSF